MVNLHNIIKCNCTILGFAENLYFVLWGDKDMCYIYIPVKMKGFFLLFYCCTNFSKEWLHLNKNGIKYCFTCILDKTALYKF